VIQPVSRANLGIRIESPFALEDLEDPAPVLTTEVVVADFIQEPADRAIYTYDHGDGWQHEVVFEGSHPIERGRKYPVVPGIRGPRHPERSVFYPAPFYHFDCFNEADPLVCPRCGGRMRVVAFPTEYAAVDRIIRDLGLTFAAEKPPPAHGFEQVALMAVE